MKYSTCLGLRLRVQGWEFKALRFRLAAAGKGFAVKILGPESSGPGISVCVLGLIRPNPNTPEAGKISTA